eukprot:13375453-Heterocapsa_arctica.AAC.1
MPRQGVREPQLDAADAAFVGRGGVDGEAAAASNGVRLDSCLLHAHRVQFMAGESGLKKGHATRAAAVLLRAFLPPLPGQEGIHIRRSTAKGLEVAQHRRVLICRAC